MGLDLVPRQGAQMVDPDSMSVVELYHVHVSSAENSQGLSVCMIFFSFHVKKIFLYTVTVKRHNKKTRIEENLNASLIFLHA